MRKLIFLLLLSSFYFSPNLPKNVSKTKNFDQNVEKSKTFFQFRIEINQAISILLEIFGTGFTLIAEIVRQLGIPTRQKVGVLN